MCGVLLGAVAVTFGVVVWPAFVALSPSDRGRAVVGGVLLTVAVCGLCGLWRRRR